MAIIATGLALGAAQAQQAGSKRTDAIHSAKNLGSGNGAELATYIVEKGKPLLTLVK